MPHRSRRHGSNRKNATTLAAVPQQRAAGDDRPELVEQPDDGHNGGDPLVAHLADPVGTAPAPPVPPRRTRPRVTLPPRLAALWALPMVRGIVADVAAVVIAVLDVWLVYPEDAPGYSVWLSWLAVLAMPLRRHVPFLAVLITIPGFFAGWAQLAAMIALGTLAKKHLLGWPTLVGAVLVWLCRFVQWPWSKFIETTVAEHFLNGLYGILVAGMPIALGMLVTVRAELSARIRELATSRAREQRLHAATVRSDERAKLAREMHDVVSHQVTLIAMQAGALSVGATDSSTREAAETIRVLSTRTLEELRELVGVLRTDSQPGLEYIDSLIRCDIPVTLEMNVSPEALPGEVSSAAYRTVQEALTNVRKHAGGAAASVRVEVVGGDLVIEIRNERAVSVSSGLPSGGHGLVGLRERACLLGGSFAAGATGDGGFRVLASYPLS